MLGWVVLPDLERLGELVHLVLSAWADPCGVVLLAVLSAYPVILSSAVASLSTAIWTIEALFTLGHR